MVSKTGVGWGISRATAQRLGGAVIVVPPGTNTLVSAINANTAKGVTLQLQAGTYNEDFTKLGATVKDVYVIGAANPGGQTNKPASQYTTGQSVISITAAPTVDDTTIWTNYGFERVVFTGPSMGPTSGIIKSHSSSGGDWIRCLFFDMAGDVIGTTGHGAGLYMEANTYLQSTTPPTMAQRVNLPLGPYWSVNEVFDFQITSTGRYIGTSGAAPSAGTVYGPYFIWGIQAGLSGQWSQDTCLDFEFGASAGLGYVEVIGAKVTNMKLAYCTNVHEAHFIKPTQVVNLQYSGVPGGGTPIINQGGTTTDIGATNGFIELDSPTIIHETNSSPVSPGDQFPVLVWGAKTAQRGEYTRRFWWHGGNVLLNPASGQPGAGTQPKPAAIIFHTPTSDAFTQVFDELTVEDVTFGYNRSAVDSSAAAPTAVPIVQVSGETTATIGKLKLGPFRVMGATGSTTTITNVPASTFTYTHGTAISGGTFATGPCVVNVTGGTVTAISTVINGVTTVTGLTKGSWYLNIGDQLVITETGAPTMVFYNVQGDLSQPTTGGDGTHSLFTFPYDIGQAAVTLTVAESTFEVCQMTELAANSSSVTSTSPLLVNTAGTVTLTKVRYIPIHRNFLPGQTAAVANVLTVTPPWQGDWEANGFVAMVAWTTPANSHLSVDYTNENNTAKNNNSIAINANGAGTASPNIGTANQDYSGMPYPFRAKSGTAIVLHAAVFTGSPSYDVAMWLRYISDF